MPGTTSSAGRMSTSTVSDSTRRRRASALTCARASGPAAGGDAACRFTTVLLARSPEPQVLLALPLGDDGVVRLPLAALVLDERAVERRPEHVAGQLVALERVDGLAERARQPAERPPPGRVLHDLVGVGVDRVARVEPLAHALQAGGQGERGDQVDVGAGIGG